jgi:thiol-disulfide isomerase/thioredoxin
VLEEIRGPTLPAPVGFEPLNLDEVAWNRAASLEAAATLIAFWARWCLPCWKEMEELDDLDRRHHADGLEVLAVTRYEDPGDPAERRSDFDKAVAFLDGRDLTIPAAITDRDELYAACRVTTPPGLVLVDAGGRVVDFAIGLDRAREVMQRAVAMLADAAPRSIPSTSS